MKVQFGAIATLLTLSVVSVSAASEITPAWQEPGFVMEEIVVIASAGDVAAAAREQLHRRARTLVASGRRSDRSR